MMFGMLLFTGVDTIVKHISQTLPNGQILTIFGVGTFFIFLAMLVRSSQPIFHRRYLHRAVFLRGAGEIIGGGFLVVALAHASLSGVTIMLQTVPIIMTIMAFIFLQERLSFARIFAIGLGFFGAVIIIQPDKNSESLYLIFALISAFGLALRDFSVRIAPAEISVPALSAFGAFSVIIAGSIFMVIEGGNIWPSPQIAGLCILMIGLAATGLWSIARCMQLADISITSPFRYSRIVFGITMGVIVFGEQIELSMIIGSILIFSAGLISWAIEIGFHRKQDS